MKFSAVTCLAQAAAAFTHVLLPYTASVPLDALVANAVDHLTNSPDTLRIHTLADNLGLTQRQLLRRFVLATGLTPKEYARICRTRSACIESLADSRSWVEISANQGFADQAHLGRLGTYQAVPKSPKSPR